MTPDPPACAHSSIRLAIWLSQGIRSLSVSGTPRAILAMFAAGCSWSPSVKGQPSRLATRAPTVVLPLPDTPATITITGACCAARSLAQAERRIPVGDENERVPGDAVVPSDDSLHEVEDPARVVPSEHDREPRHDDSEEHPDIQEDQHDVMRDGQEPLHQR